MSAPDAMDLVIIGQALRSEFSRDEQFGCEECGERLHWVAVADFSKRRECGARDDGEKLIRTLDRLGFKVERARRTG